MREIEHWTRLPLQVHGASPLLPAGETGPALADPSDTFRPTAPFAGTDAGLLLPGTSGITASAIGIRGGGVAA